MRRPPSWRLNNDAIVPEIEAGSDIWGGGTRADLRALVPAACSFGLEFGASFLGLEKPRFQVARTAIRNFAVAHGRSAALQAFILP